MPGDQGRQVSLFHEWGGASNLDVAIRHVDSLPTPAERYNSLLKLLGVCVDVAEAAEILAYKVNAKMISEQAWKWVGKTQAEFEKEHNVGRASAVVNRGRKSLEEKESILKKIKDHYPEAYALLVDTYSGCLEWSISSMVGGHEMLPGKDHLTEVLKFCSQAKQNGIGWVTCRNALLRAIQIRLETAAKPKTLCLTRADAAQALSILSNNSTRQALREISREDWTKSAAKRDAAHKVDVHPTYRFPINLDLEAGKDAIRRAQSASSASFPDFSPLPRSQSGDLRLDASSFTPINPSGLRQSLTGGTDTPGPSRRSSTATHSRHPSGSVQSKRLSSTSDDLPADSPPRREFTSPRASPALPIIQSRRPSGASQGRVVSGGSDASNGISQLRDEIDAAELNDDELGRLHPDDQVEKAREKQAKRDLLLDNNQADEGRRCECSDMVKKRITSVLRGNNTLTNAETMKLLGVFLILAGDQPENATQQHRNICYSHLVRVAGQALMKHNNCKYPVLFSRVKHVAINRARISALKSADNTYTWFLRSGRPAVLADELGAYRFNVSDPSLRTNQFILTEAAAMNLRRNISSYMPEFTQASYRNYQATGNGVWPAFRWLMDRDIGRTGDQEAYGLLSLFETEFIVYEHHQREDIFGTKLGWLRTMYHSLCQQLIRQDLLYYALYVALRDDNAAWLISYPYYVKSTKPGDNTKFRHIDINLQQLHDTGRGSTQIQGTVALTDDNPANCTEILPTLQKLKKLRLYWERLGKRGAQTGDGFVHDMSAPAMWTTEDEKALETKWEKVACKKGDARITSPALPHGSNGPATIERRTVLPWFVKVQPDHHTLEIPDSGTWGELAAAHRDLIPGPLTPSGYAVKYAKVPYRFPAAVKLLSDHPISRCLVGSARWDEPEVRLLLGELFSEKTSPKDFKAAIDANRQYLAKRARGLWRYFVLAEMRAFGKNSAFNRAGWNPKGTATYSDVFPITKDHFAKLRNLARATEEQLSPMGEQYMRGVSLGGEVESVFEGVVPRRVQPARAARGSAQPPS